jgi:siroheme synthase
MANTVYFIGAGPGAADLITLRGAQRLALADVVLFDALTDPALREHGARHAGSTWASAASAMPRAGPSTRCWCAARSSMHAWCA